MKTLRNLGHHERIIRVGIGLALLALSGFSAFPGWGDFLLMVVGLIALLTGIIGYCPAWKAMGISSCKVNPDLSGPSQKKGLHEHGTASTHQT